MADLTAIRQAAQIVVDERGETVVQLPLSLWETLMDQLDAGHPQSERIKSLLAEWDTQPDDTPPEWWDDFEAFLARQRLSLEDRDLGLASS